MADQGNVFIGKVKTAGEADAALQERELASQGIELNRMRLTDAVEKRNAEIAAARQKQEQDAWLSQASQKFVHDDGSPDYETISNEASKRYPDLGFALQDRLAKGRKQLADAHKVELDNKKAEHDADLDLVKRMTDPRSFDIWRRRISDPELQELLGNEFDPQRVASLVEAGLSESERINRLKFNADLYDKGNPHEAFLRDISEATSEQDITDALIGARLMLPAQAVQSWMQRLGNDPAAMPGRAKALLDTPEMQQRRAALEQTAKDNAANQKLRAGELAVAQGNLKVRQQEANKPAGDGGAGGAKLSAGAVEKVAGVDQSIGMLDDIERLLPKMADFIGPMDGRVAKGRLITGAGVTPELAEFDAQLTGLKNAVIKATTGAAMSEPEAKRIMGQLPDLNLPEPVFKARLATTRKNLDMLKRRTIELSGGTVTAPTSKADPLGIRRGGG